MGIVGVDTFGEAPGMLRRTIVLLVVFFIALIVFVWAENEVASSFKSCIFQNTSEQSAKDSKHNSLIVTGIIKSQTICSLRLIDRHNGLFAALATTAIAFFTLTLWRATTKQVKLTRDSINLGRAEFNATHRPRLRVRRIVAAPLTASAPPRAATDVANIGDGNARITAMGVDIFPRYPNPEKTAFGAVPPP
jgi:hypothetical protein